MNKTISFAIVLGLLTTLLIITSANATEVNNDSHIVHIRFYNFFSQQTSISFYGESITPKLHKRSNYHAITIDSSQPFISFSVNSQPNITINGPFTHNKYSYFLYESIAYANTAEVITLPDIPENPIHHAQIYEKDTLWRLVVLPP